jgi:pyruvate kinase
MDSDLSQLAAEVAQLRADLVAAHEFHRAAIAGTHPMHRRSAENLIHYRELRKHDRHELQAKLGVRGLSSLRRCEANVLATIEAVRGVLLGLVGDEPSPATAAIALGARRCDQLKKCGLMTTRSVASSTR